MFGIGMQELVIILIVGGVLFFFGKDKFKEWATAAKEVLGKNNSKETNKA